MFSQLTVLSDHFSPHLTSDVAGASFIPTDKDYPPSPDIQTWVSETGAALYAIVRATHKINDAFES